MKEQTESWLLDLKPIVEKEFGELPDFSIKYRNSYKPATEIHYKNNRFVIRMPQKSNSIINFLGPFPLIHEVMHLYQAEPLVKKLGAIRHLPEILVDAYVRYDISSIVYPFEKFINPNSIIFNGGKYCEWLEGSAQLCTTKVIYDFFEKTKTENIWLKNFTLQISSWLAELAHEKFLETPDLKELNLPFEIPQRAEEYIKQSLSLPFINTTKTKTSCYEQGWLRCAKALPHLENSLKKLLKTPMTNKELKKLAGI